MWRTLALVSFALAGGCSTMTDKPAASPALVGPVWVLEDLGGRGIVDSSRADATFTADGKVYGRASCNRFSGGYSRAGEALSLSFTPAAVTRMACSEALMNQENRFLAVMQGTRKLGFTKDGALVIGEGETSATFRAEAATSAK